MTTLGVPRSARRRAGRVAPALVVPAVAGLALLMLPVLALLVRAPWTSLGPRLGTGGVGDALRLSLLSAVLATTVCLIVGVPLAVMLARSGLPGLRVLRALVTVPLVLPPVVGGFALLLLLGRNGVLGGPLYRLTGITVPFSTAAVVLAQSFVALPFLVLAVEGALRSADPRYEQVAATLGASRGWAFRHVTLPLVAPGVLAGAVLCFARALGEFGATIMFAGNLPGRTQTMPLAVYQNFQTDPQTAVVLSLVLLTMSLAVLVGLRDRWLGR